MKGGGLGHRGAWSGVEAECREGHHPSPGLLLGLCNRGAQGKEDTDQVLSCGFIGLGQSSPQGRVREGPEMEDCGRPGVSKAGYMCIEPSQKALDTCIQSDFFGCII